MVYKNIYIHFQDHVHIYIYMLYIYIYMHIYIYMGKFHHALTVLPKPGIMV
jgi:hypothetical protein